MKYLYDMAKNNFSTTKDRRRKNATQIIISHQQLKCIFYWKWVWENTKEIQFLDIPFIRCYAKLL